MNKFIYGLAVLGLSPLSINANELYLDLNTDTFHVRGDATHASNGIEYSAELVSTNDNGHVIAFSMWNQGQVGKNSNLFGGLGAKLYGADIQVDQVLALGLGGNLKFNIPAVSGLSVTTELFYAPSITVTESYENFRDLNLRLHYELFENGAIYVGLRSLQAKQENGANYTVDDGLHAGINLTF